MYADLKAPLFHSYVVASLGSAFSIDVVCASLGSVDSIDVVCGKMGSVDAGLLRNCK